MTLEEIKQIVEGYVGFNINTRKRTEDFVAARYIYIMLGLEFTTETDGKTGALVGRDHATVVHCKKVFTQSILSNDRYAKWYYDCKIVIGKEIKARKIISMDSFDSILHENQSLKTKLKGLREPLDAEQERLVSIFNSLPERLREDVKFKVETAYKINEKHKRDLNVIYTEG